MIEGKFTAFCSDFHFGHANIIKYCNRPFSSKADMTEKLVENYNQLIGPEDMVLWVGDCFFMKATKSKEVLSSMNGKKVLVRGNHDRGPKAMLDMGFESVHDTLTLTIAGRKVLVCHFPYANAMREDGTQDTRFLELRPKRYPGQVLIHGHSHSPHKTSPGCVHVGVDAWDYRPAMYDEVAALVAASE